MKTILVLIIALLISSGLLVIAQKITSEQVAKAMIELQQATPQKPIKATPAHVEAFHQAHPGISKEVVAFMNKIASNPDQRNLWLANNQMRIKGVKGLADIQINLNNPNVEISVVSEGSRKYLKIGRTTIRGEESIVANADINPLNGQTALTISPEGDPLRQLIIPSSGPPKGKGMPPDFNFDELFKDGSPIIRERALLEFKDGIFSVAGSSVGSWVG